MSLLGDIAGWFEGNKAANTLANANSGAEQLVQGATTQGETGINSATAGAQGGIDQALTNAGNTMGTGNTQANSTLGDTLSRTSQATGTYQQAGQAGLQGLEQYTNSPGSQFSFNLNDYLNSPAMQFQEQQGDQGIQNSLSATGMANSGAAAKQLSNYNQGVASTYYNQAYNQAQQTFSTNQNAKMQDLGSEINAGEFGTGQYNSANTTTGTQMAGNDMTTAQLLSQLGVQGAESSGSLGVQGADEAAKLGLAGETTAGNFGVGAGQALAGGDLAKGNAIAGGGSDIASLLLMMGG